MWLPAPRVPLTQDDPRREKRALCSDLWGRGPDIRPCLGLLAEVSALVFSYVTALGCHQACPWGNLAQLALCRGILGVVEVLYVEGELRPGSLCGL